MRAARLVVVLAVLWSVPAHADHGKFGLGLIVGQPTGLTGAYDLSEKSQIDAALGLALFDDRDFYIHVEYLYYPFTLVHGGDLDLSAYLGIGGWIVTVHDPVIGARAPFGLSLDFNTAPIQIFLEASVLVSIVPDAHGAVRGAAGFRYYF
ncbi:MAG TPA: hypothetical protein VFV99_32700 [Kofleriaceae bacterium]|nr:hypothetical protein [Kofleriaceae bacterium]